MFFDPNFINAKNVSWTFFGFFIISLVIFDLPEHTIPQIKAKDILLRPYSLRPKLLTKYCFMKQNCQLHSGIAQYGNAATPVSSKAIHATH